MGFNFERFYCILSYFMSGSILVKGLYFADGKRKMVICSVKWRPINCMSFFWSMDILSGQKEENG